MPYVTSQGQPISLGKMLAENARASVYEIAGDAARVAKIYAQPPLEKQSRKLVELVRLNSPDLQRVAAWPVDTLHAAVGEPICGIVMRKVAASLPLDHLHSPARRSIAFPHADWRFLIQAARNCAVAVQQVHGAGVVLGDVSSGRFLANAEAGVTLIGCDAFQIKLGDDTLFSTTTVAEYLAPEMQAVPLESFPHTPNHDAFGLAVILFRLLMQGQHPYAGYRGPNKLSIGETIREYRYAYGATAATLLMEPPPQGPLLSDLPGSVGALFNRAFARGSEQAKARPTPLEWIKALDDLQRQCTPCATDPGHVYLGSLPQCPWCRIERTGGPSYFSSVTLQALETGPSPPDSHQVLDEFEIIAPPERYFQQLKSAPLLPAQTTQLSQSTRNFQQVVMALGVLTLASALIMLLGLLTANFFYIAAPITFCLSIGWLLAYFGSPLFRLRFKRRRTLAARKAELAQVEREMEGVLTRINADWTPRYKAASQVRDQLRALETQEAAEMQALQSILKQRQLDDFLAHYFLSESKIEKLTPSRLTVLQSFHLETARDVTERSLHSVPGLGQSLPAMLLAWRRSAEASFRFDPARGLPPEETAKIRSRYQQQRQALQEQLEVDSEALARVSATARLQANHFTVPLASRQSAVVQAEADLAACRKT